MNVRPKLTWHSIFAKDPFGSPSPRYFCRSSIIQGVKSLPVDCHLWDIQEKIERSVVTIVEGATGCGKSTRIPQRILDACLARGEPCRIAVTEPRKVACQNLSERVAQERGQKLCAGEASVGFVVWETKMLPYPLNGITFLPPKIFLNRLRFGSYSHVFLDEVHERSADIDLTLKVLRMLLREGHRFKLVLMTATGQNEFFRSYFSQLSVELVNIPGRCFRIYEYFLDDVSSLPQDWSLPDHIIVEAVTWCRKQMTRWHMCGDVLVFLADKKDIAVCTRHLLVDKERNDGAFDVYPFHSTVSAIDRAAVMGPAPQQKVILSTNIAELSITIDGVVCVIDFCEEKLMMGRRLVKVSASKASCHQRKGRAGRTRPGMYLTMLSKAKFAMLPDHRVPEVQRTPCTSILLYLLSHSLMTNTSEARQTLDDMPTKPDVARLAQDVEDLETLGLTVNGNLTLIGEKIAHLPCSAESGLALLAGVMLGVGRDVALALAAQSSEKFTRALSKHDGIKDFMFDWAGTDQKSEVFAAATFLENYMRKRHENRCSRAPIQPATTGDPRIFDDVLTCYETLCKAVDQLEEKDGGPRACPNASDGWFEETWPWVDFALTCGFRNNIFMYLRNRRYEAKDGQENMIHTDSFMPEPDGEGAVVALRRINHQLCGLSTCKPLSLLAFGHNPPTPSLTYLGIKTMGDEHHVSAKTL